MANLGINFDASRVQPYEPGLPVWEGRVPHVVMRTEIKPTAANDGNSMLVFHVKAIDAPYLGQENVIRLNLYHKSPQTVDIAQRQLSSMCHVTGKMTMTDSDQLIGVPFIGLWVKEVREIMDQTTGAKRMVEGCQCKDFALIDGRTIKEAMTGQPASAPYIPGVTGVQEAQARGGGQVVQPVQQPQPMQQPQQAPQQQGGFVPPAQGGFGPQGAAPGGQPGFQPAPPAQGGAQQGGFAPAQGQGAPAPSFGQPAPAGPGFGTAQSPSSQQGFAPPQQQGGFAPPQQGGFAAPTGPQAGPGPWGPGAAPQGGFGPR